MNPRALAVSLAALACVSAAFVVAVSPGDTVTISGCSTRLELAGNVVTCVLETPTPTTAPTSTPVPSPTHTSTPTRTPTVVATFTPTPTVTFLPTVTKESSAIIGLAIVGDSTQDEYAAPENNRGAVNWVEHLARSGVPFGAWGGWGEPRRNGYAFNWARSGATSAGARSEQAPGVLAQIQSGQVSHVIIQVGINDIGQLSPQIVAGTVTDGALNHVADNIVEAARPLANAAPGRVMVAPVQDYTGLNVIPNPEYGQLTPLLSARVSAAVAKINARVLANLPPGAVWFDWNAAMATRVGQLRTADTLVLAGNVVNIRARCGAWNCGWVSDTYMHPESVISGLFAQVFADGMRAAWGVSVPVLTDSEIIARAR